MACHNFFVRTKKAMAPAAEPKGMFTVLKIVSGGGGGEEEGGAAQPRVSVRGLHPTEEQAYAAAIVELIYDLEQSEGAAQPKLRAIAKTETLPLKDRLKSLQSCQGLEEPAEFVIKKSLAFPEEKEMKDMNALLEGPLLPCSYWDSSDEEDYNPDEEEGEDDDDDEEEEEDDDMEDLVNEDDAMQGIEGSGPKGEEEPKAEDEKKPE